MIYIISIVVIFLFIFPLNTEAFSGLGSISNNQRIAYSSPGSNVELKYSFFNKGDEDLNLEVSYELLNEGTLIDLFESYKRVHLMDTPYPSTLNDVLYLTLPPLTRSPANSQDKEWIALDGGTTYAEVKNAYLLVQIPADDIHANPYRIKVIATSVPEPVENKATNKVAQKIEYIVEILNNATKVELIGDDVDSDNDGLTDKDEKEKYHTNPFKKDTDGDGITDGDEVRNSTDPNNPDNTAAPSSGYSSYLETRPKPEMIEGIRNVSSSESYEDEMDGTHSTYNPTVNQPMGDGEDGKSNEEDNTARSDDTTTEKHTGFVVDAPISGPFNISTILIIIIGVIFLYQMAKTRV